MIINPPQAGEAHQPWLATHLVERNSHFEPFAGGSMWHCPSLLGYCSRISCYFQSRVAQFRFSGCGVPAFASWYSTTFLTNVVDAMTLGLPQVCKLWLGVGKGMLPVKNLAPKIHMAVSYCGSQLQPKVVVCGTCLP